VEAGRDDPTVEEHCPKVDLTTDWVGGVARFSQGFWGRF
jgi:hypothetical protein